MFGLRVVSWVALAIGGGLYVGHDMQKENVEETRDLHLRQFENDDAVPQAIRQEHWERNAVYGGGVAAWLCLGGLLFAPEITRTAKGILRK